MRLTSSDLGRAEATLAAYVERLNWPIFPCHWPLFVGSKARCSCSLGEKCGSIGKHPIAEIAPNGCKSALLDVAAVKAAWRKFPQANVAGVMGRPRDPGDGQGLGGCGAIAIDVDTKPAQGKFGEEELDELERRFGKLPDTWRQRSGSGGEHIFLACPPLPWRIANRCGLMVRGEGEPFKAKAIDVRGEDGYVMLAPTVHETGKPYAFMLGNRPIEVPLAPIPEGWLQLLAVREGERPHASAGPDIEGLPAEKVRVRRAKAYLRKMPEAISGSGGHNALFSAAVTLVRGFVLPEPIVWDLLLEEYNPRCSPPWSEREISHKINQAVVRSTKPWGYAFAEDEEREKAHRAKQAGALVARAGSALSEGQRELLEHFARTGEEPPPPSEPPSSSPPSGDGAPPPFLFRRGDETELAQAVKTRLHSDDQPLIYDEGHFWRYAGDRAGVWQQIPDERVIKLVSDYARHGAVVHDPVEAKQRFLRVSASSAKGAASLLRSELIADANEAHRFEKAWRGVAFDNVFVRLNTQTGDIDPVAHHRTHMCRFAFPFAYNPKAPRDRLYEFLDAIFGDCDEQERLMRQALLQEYLGACLFGIATKYEACLVLYGFGSNGKSQVLTLARACFPPNSTVSLPPQLWGVQFQIAPLMGSLGNFCDEIPSSDIANSMRFKAIVSGQPQHCDRKNRDAITFAPVAGHIFSANELPSTVDFSKGFFSRFLLLCFTRDFDRRGGHNVERDIGARIAREEREGLVSWAIEGAARLVRNNAFTLPHSSTHALEDWKTDVDPVRRFVLERDASVRAALWPTGAGWRASEMYKKFKEYTADNGFAQMTSAKFGRRLMALGLVERVEYRDGNAYRYKPEVAHEIAVADQLALERDARRAAIVDAPPSDVYVERPIDEWPSALAFRPGREHADPAVDATRKIHPRGGFAEGCGGLCGGLHSRIWLLWRMWRISANFFYYIQCCLVYGCETNSQHARSGLRTVNSRAPQLKDVRASNPPHPPPEPILAFPRKYKPSATFHQPSILRRVGCIVSCRLCSQGTCNHQQRHTSFVFRC